jgi:Asp-tRNA(Asn)/Glu-tRNA(Gln) amidotransferase B subunit
MTDEERAVKINAMSEEEASKWLDKLPVRLSHNQAKKLFVDLFDLAIDEKRAITKKDILIYILSSPWLDGDIPDIDDAISKVLVDSKSIVTDYVTHKKDKALNALVGMVMKNTKGAYDGSEVRKRISQKIEMTV